MHILKSFFPWIIFSILTRIQVPIKGCIVALLIYMYLFLIKNKPPKLLDICSIVFFIIIILAAKLLYLTWLVDNVLYISDGFLALVILITILNRKPFTLSYAKEITLEDKWKTNEFLQINMLISFIWFLYFMLSTLLGPLFNNYFSDYMLLHITILLIAVLLTKQLPRWYLKAKKDTNEFK